MNILFVSFTTNSCYYMGLIFLGRRQWLPCSCQATTKDNIVWNKQTRFSISELLVGVLLLLVKARVPLVSTPCVKIISYWLLIYHRHTKRVSILSCKQISIFKQYSLKLYNVSFINIATWMSCYLLAPQSVWPLICADNSVSVPWRLQAQNHCYGWGLLPFLQDEGNISGMK